MQVTVACDAQSSAASSLSAVTSRGEYLNKVVGFLEMSSSSWTIRRQANGVVCDAKHRNVC